jgi:hypothetical protein
MAIQANVCGNRNQFVRLYAGGFVNFLSWYIIQGERPAIATAYSQAFFIVVERRKL